MVSRIQSFARANVRFIKELLFLRLLHHRDTFNTQLKLHLTKSHLDLYTRSLKKLPVFTRLLLKTAGRANQPKGNPLGMLRRLVSSQNTRQLLIR